MDVDILRQDSIQPAQHSADAEVGVRPEARNLSPGMDSGIGAAGTDQVDGLLQDLVEDFGDLVLDAPPVGL